MSNGGSSPVGRRALSVLAAFAALSLMLLVSACSKPPAPLPNDAYVWQRKWTPAVTSALRDSSGFVQTWHVLAAEKDRKDDWTVVSPDWATLAATHAPVTAVVRIDGQLDDLNTLPVARIVQLADNWKQHGIELAGIENLRLARDVGRRRARRRHRKRAADAAGEWIRARSVA